MWTAALYGLVAALAQHGGETGSSGILLESPELPEGTLTVRVAKGGMTDTIVGAEVSIRLGGKKQTARTNQEGRARFDGLPPGATVVASMGDVQAQPVTIPHGVGARMLLFVPLEEAPGGALPGAQPPTEAPHPPGEAGQRPTGAPHTPAEAGHPRTGAPPEEAGMPAAATMSGIPLPSPDLPTGTVLVRIAKGGLNETLPDAEVVIESDGKRHVAKADSEGRARFEGLSPGAEGVASVGEVRTPAFTVPTQGGARMLVFVPTAGSSTLPGEHPPVGAPRAGPPGATPHTMPGDPHAGAFEPKPGGGLVISNQTHIVAEIQDDKMEFLEVLHLVNEGPTRSEGKLVIPLPEDASDIAVDPDLEGRLRPEDGSVVWTGPVPPGPLELRFSFRLPINDGNVVLHQPAQLPWRGYGVIAREIEGMTLTGPGLGQQQMREMDDQRFVMTRGDAIPAGGTLKIRFAGLPSVGSTGRRVASVLALALIGWALVASWRIPRVSVERGRLSARRAHLMGELVALERKGRAGEASANPQRAKLISEIESLDRSLGEIEA